MQFNLSAFYYTGHFLFRYLLMACSFFLFYIKAQGQVLDSTALAEAFTYSSLEEALKEPEKVYKLSLKKNHLESFPMEILQFKNIQFLDLSRNKIVEIPVEIKNLTLLQELNLSRNEIEEIPKEITKLTHLKALYLNQNNIAAIPVQIGNLSKLEILDMWSNDLVFFPDELEQLKNLKKLDLRAILLSENEQKRIEELLPHVKIYFSPSCNCGY